MSRPTIFISYSRKDKALKKDLCDYLKPLVLRKKLAIWEDGQIPAGDEFWDKIKEGINMASGAILLISRGFLASDFIHKKERPYLLTKVAQEQLIVFPVLIEPCLWEESWLKKREMRPRGARPISSFRSHKRGEEWVKIAIEIYERVEGSMSKSKEKKRPIPARKKVQTWSEYVKANPRAKEDSQRLVQHMVRYVESHATPVDFDAVQAEKEKIFEALEIADLPSMMKILAVLGRLHNGFFEYRGNREDLEEGLKYCDRALEAAREQGYDGRNALANLICITAGLYHKVNDFDTARELLRPLINARKWLDMKTRINALHIMGMIEFSLHHYPMAQRYFRRELKLSEADDGREIDLWGVANATQELGRIARVSGRFKGDKIRGRFGEARRYFERSLEVRSKLEDPSTPPQQAPARKSSLHDLGLTAHQEGEWEQLHGNEEKARDLYQSADALYSDAFELKYEHKLTNSEAHTLTEMAELERLRAGLETLPSSKNARYNKARKSLEKSLRIKKKQGDELHMAYSYYILGRVALDEGKLDEAERHWRESYEIRDRRGDSAGLTGCKYLRAMIEEKRGNKREAARLFGEVFEEWQEKRLIAAEYARVALGRVSQKRS